jgi:hypothetical protein
MNTVHREWVESLRQFLRATNRLVDHHIDEIEDGLIWTFLLPVGFLIGGGLLIYLEIITPPVPRVYLWGIIILSILFAWRKLLLIIVINIYVAWLDRLH